MNKPKSILRSNIGIFARIAAIFAKKPKRTTSELSFSIVPKSRSFGKKQPKSGMPGSKLGRRMRRRNLKGGWFQPFDKTPEARSERNKQRRKAATAIERHGYESSKAFQAQREDRLRYLRG